MHYDDGDDLTDPMDDGNMALPPFAFDPLCELRGSPYPCGNSNGEEYDSYYEWERSLEEAA